MLGLLHLVLESTAVYAVGQNNNLQLGPGSDLTQFTEQSFVQQPYKLIGNWYNSFYLDVDGNLYGRGNFDRGLLVTQLANTPDFVHINPHVGGKKITQYHTTGDNMIILTEQNEVYTGGKNKFGQLGRNTSDLIVSNYEKIDYDFGLVKKVGATNDLFQIVWSNTGLYGTIYDNTARNQNAGWKEIPLPNGVEKIVDFQCLQKSFIIYDQEGQMWNMTNYQINEFTQFTIPGAIEGERIVAWKDAVSFGAFNTTAGRFFTRLYDFSSGTSVALSTPKEIQLPTGWTYNDIQDFTIIESGMFVMSITQIYAYGKNANGSLGLNVINETSQNWTEVDTTMIPKPMPNSFSEAISYQTYLYNIYTSFTLNIEIRTASNEKTSQIHVKITNKRNGKVITQQMIDTVLSIEFKAVDNLIQMGDDILIEATDNSLRYTNVTSTINIFKTFMNEVLKVEELVTQIKIIFNGSKFYNPSQSHVKILNGNKVIFNDKLTNSILILTSTQLQGTKLNDIITVTLIDDYDNYQPVNENIIINTVIFQKLINLTSNSKFIKQLNIQYNDPTQQDKKYLDGSAIIKLDKVFEERIKPNASGWIVISFIAYNLPFGTSVEVTFIPELPYVQMKSLILIDQEEITKQIALSCQGDNKEITSDSVCKCKLGYKGEPCEEIPNYCGETQFYFYDHCHDCNLDTQIIQDYQCVCKENYTYSNGVCISTVKTDPSNIPIDAIIGGVIGSLLFLLLLFLLLFFLYRKKKNQNKERQGGAKSILQKIDSMNELHKDKKKSLKRIKPTKLHSDNVVSQQPTILQQYKSNEQLIAANEATKEKGDSFLIE